MKPILCRQFRAWLVDSLCIAADAEARDRFEAHRQECRSCDAAAEELHASWQLFTELPPLSPPSDLHDRTRRTVLSLLDANGRRSAWRAPDRLGRMPLAVVSGVAMTAATLSLLGGLIGGSGLPQGHLFLCSAAFTGLLVGAFAWIYSATTVNGVHLDAAARVGVLALAITVAATTACPEFHVLSWWERSFPGHAATHLLGVGASALIFGFGYGMAPGFLASLLGGRLLDERPAANAVVAAAVVFLLAIPVIYLQSAPFTSVVLATWLVGAAAGTFFGVVGGQLSALRIRERVRPLLAAP